MTYRSGFRRATAPLRLFALKPATSAFRFMTSRSCGPTCGPLLNARHVRDRARATQPNRRDALAPHDGCSEPAGLDHSIRDGHNHAVAHTRRLALAYIHRLGHIRNLGHIRRLAPGRIHRVPVASSTDVRRKSMPAVKLLRPPKSALSRPRFCSSSYVLSSP